MRNGIAWLVERNTKGHAEWFGDVPLFFTDDPNKVIRFSRKEDADAMIRFLKLKDCIASEHMWMDVKTLPDKDDEDYSEL